MQKIKDRQGQKFTEDSIPAQGKLIGEAILQYSQKLVFTKTAISFFTPANA